jgi:hypothetical protein
MFGVDEWVLAGLFTMLCSCLAYPILLHDRFQEYQKRIGQITFVLATIWFLIGSLVCALMKPPCYETTVFWFMWPVLLALVLCKAKF